MSPIIGFVFLIIWIVKAINKTFSEVNSNNAETKAPVLNNFSNNKLNETRKRTVYLHQYYVNEQPIFGNHQDYYLNYLVNLQPTEITVSTLKVAYQNTIMYPHKCKSTTKARLLQSI
jgi:hypothetical protein